MTTGYTAQAAHEQHVARVRASIREDIQPCPVCFRDVHPTNFDAHMKHYHPGESAVFINPDAFDYNALSIENRVTLLNHAREIKVLKRTAVQAIVDIGERLSDAKKRIKYGQYLDWVRHEFGWTERAAQRLVNTYDAFGSDNLSSLTLGRSALYLLSAPSCPPSAREEAANRNRAGEKITVEGAKQIIELHKTTPAVQEVVTAYGVTSTETIHLLTEIEGSETFAEIRASGHIQPGDERSAVHVTAPVEDLQAAIWDKAAGHKAAAASATAPSGSVMHDNGVYVASINLGEFTSHAAAEKALAAALKKLSKGC